MALFLVCSFSVQAVTVKEALSTKARNIRRSLSTPNVHNVRTLYPPVNWYWWCRGVLLVCWSQCLHNVIWYRLFWARTNQPIGALSWLKMSQLKPSPPLPVPGDNKVGRDRESWSKLFSFSKDTLFGSSWGWQLLWFRLLLLHSPFKFFRSWRVGFSSVCILHVLLSPTPTAQR